MIFLWGFDNGAPLFFKIFGSFIAAAFILFSGLGITAAVGRRSPPPLKTSRKTGHYQCPNCGASIENADVSPSGDLRCEYCSKWWNIHQA